MNGLAHRVLGGGRFSLPALALAVAWVCIALLVVRTVELDRNQESLYLGEPYANVRDGNIFLNARDPFEENGMHAVLLPAFVLKVTGSLGMMRVYLSIFSLVAILLMYQLCLRYGKGGMGFSAQEPWSVALACLSIWCALPLIFQYPLQCNGMMFGFAWAVLAVLVYEGRPALAMVFFGCAASTKGQFLTYVPAILLYQALIRRQSHPWAQRILPTAGDLFLLLSPHFVLSFMALVLGWFKSREDFVHYLFMQITLMSSFIGKAIAPFFKSPALGAPSFLETVGARYWKFEFHTYGALSWALILFSVGVSVYFAAQAVYRLIQHRPQNSVDGLLGFVLLPFWMNYLIFWGYPFWYNVLAVLPFNVYFFIRLTSLGQEGLKRWAPLRIQRMAPWVMGGCLMVLLINRVSYYRPWVAERKGNAFEGYPWMLQ